MNAALDGIRVVDSAVAVAGPWVARVLGEFGAEVIRVETPSRPHRSRMQHIPDGKADEELYWEQGAAHHDIHRNKRGIALEISNPLGREVFKRLVAISDVVVENSPPRVMKGFGLDYPRLREVNPQIIMFSTTGYGHGGPYSPYRAYGQTIEPMAGLTSMMGYGTPRTGNIPFPDQIAAYHGAFAVMSALRQRRLTGKGQWIDLSQYEATMGCFGEAFLDYAMNQRLRVPMRNRDDVMVPHGCYPCRGTDKWVAIAVRGDEQWRALCAEMGNPAWSATERFAQVEGRRADQDELDKLVGEWTDAQDQYEVTQRLQKIGIAAAPVLSMKGLFLDPQMQERNLFHVVEYPSTHPRVGRRPIPGPTQKLSETPAFTRRTAPTFGRDNEWVLRDLLGMSAEELRQLGEAEVVGTKPLPWVGKPPPQQLPPDQAFKLGRFKEYDPDYKDILGAAYGRIG